MFKLVKVLKYKLIKCKMKINKNAVIKVAILLKKNNYQLILIYMKENNKIKSIQMIWKLKKLVYKNKKK